MQAHVNERVEPLGATWETWVFASICALDLLSTLILMHAGAAGESNPLLGYYLRHGGVIAFAGAKALLVIGPLLVLELLRKKRPRFVRMLLRTSISAYVVLYVILSVVVNRA